MMSSKELQDFSPIRDEVLELGLEEVIILLESFVSDKRYEYIATICRRIHKGTGIYIKPERLEKVAQYMRIIKRMWTPLGWKYIRMRTLDDYIDL